MTNENCQQVFIYLSRFANYSAGDTLTLSLPKELALYTALEFNVLEGGQFKWSDQEKLFAVDTAKKMRLLPLMIICISSTQQTSCSSFWM